MAGSYYEPISRALNHVFAAAANPRAAAGMSLKIQPILAEIPNREHRLYLADIMDEIEEARGSLPELNRIREKVRVWHVKAWPGIPWPKEWL
jgi:hypothetical protein